MADIKINHLPAASGIAGTDLMLIGDPVTGLIKQVPFSIVLAALSSIPVVPVVPLSIGIYFGMGPVPTTAVQIQAGTFQAITAGGNYTITWPPNNGNGDHYWVAEPDTEPVKIKSSDGTYDEPIGIGQTFAASTISTFKMYSTGITILSATTLKTA